MMMVRGLAVLAILAVLPSVASAETTRERQEKACQADVYKFCKDDVPDEAKITVCMGKHRPQLSPNCGLMFDNGK